MLNHSHDLGRSRTDRSENDPPLHNASSSTGTKASRVEAILPAAEGSLPKVIVYRFEHESGLRATIIRKTWVIKDKPRKCALCSWSSSYEFAWGAADVRSFRKKLIRSMIARQLCLCFESCKNKSRNPKHKNFSAHQFALLVFLSVSGTVVEHPYR
jgi:hypothetical protein